jgi:hypothetical protein
VGSVPSAARGGTRRAHPTRHRPATPPDSGDDARVGPRGCGSPRPPRATQGELTRCVCVRASVFSLLPCSHGAMSSRACPLPRTPSVGQGRRSGQARKCRLVEGLPAPRVGSRQARSPCCLQEGSPAPRAGSRQARRCAAFKRAHPLPVPGAGKRQLRASPLGRAYSHDHVRARGAV